MLFRSLLCATLLLAGCGGVAPKIVEKPILVDRPELIVPEVQPAQQYDFEWIVVTRENFDTVARELESRGQTIVLFAITPQGYQNLSLSIARIGNRRRRFLASKSQPTRILSIYRPLKGWQSIYAMQASTTLPSVCFTRRSIAPGSDARPPWACGKRSFTFATITPDFA